jgi:hypothetical protein
VSCRKLRPTLKSISALPGLHMDVFRDQVETVQLGEHNER